MLLREVKWDETRVSSKHQRDASKVVCLRPFSHLCCDVVVLSPAVSSTLLLYKKSVVCVIEFRIGQECILSLSLYFYHAKK